MLEHKLKRIYVVSVCVISLYACALPALSADLLRFVSIENLVEQQIGHIILPQIYAQMGQKIRITPVPGKRAEEELLRGRADGEIMRIFSYGENVANAIRVVPSYYYLQTMAFIRASSNIQVTHPSVLANFRVAVVSGVKHTENITKGFKAVYPVASTVEMFRLLRAGMVDVALTNSLDGEIHLRKLGWENDIKPAGESLATLPLYHYLDNAHKSVAVELGKIITRMKESGELDELVGRAEKKVIDNMLSAKVESSPSTRDPAAGR